MIVDKVRLKIWRSAVAASVAILATFHAAPLSALGARDIVERVDDSGSIFLEGDDKALELWGLRLTDIRMLEVLIVGKFVRCSIVTETDDVRLVDCNVEPDREFLTDPDYLNLYAWLPAIGAANYDCPVHHRPPDRTAFSNEEPVQLRGEFKIGPMGYGCTRAALPIRGTIIYN